jgi:hypothetical protein
LSSISLKAQRLVDANRESPLVYQSASSDEDEITFRLRDGQRFDLSTDEARALARAGYVPQWAHLPHEAMA